VLLRPPESTQLGSPTGKAGINRRTGTRWRYGRTATSQDGAARIHPPISAPKQAASAPYLSEAERTVITDECVSGNSIRTVAEQLSQAPSTISREIKRNSDPVAGNADELKRV